MQTQIASINHDFAAQANTQKYSNAFMCQHDNLKAGKLSESSTNRNLWSNEIGDAPNNNEGKIDLYRLQFFSPAEHVPSEMTMKSLLNPVARLDTTLMNTAHRVELPMICSQKQSELRSRRLRNRSENAKNSLPDKINETILKYSVVTTGGLERPMCALDLFDRGLIPPNVQVQFHPPVMRTSTALIHDSKECEDKIKISVSDFRVYEHTFNTDGNRRIYGKGAMRTQPGPVSLRSVHSGDDHSTPVAEIQLPKYPMHPTRLPQNAN